MFERLNELEKNIQSFTYFYSLNPHKLRPTKPSEIYRNESIKLTSIHQKKIFLDLLVDLYLSQIENFPMNIFWDFDYLASQISSYKNSEEMKNYGIKLLKLNEIFGKKGHLNFSYSHDFIYGFDWFRWLQKDFEKRKNIGPFDPIFLDFLENRADELKELIKKNDNKYPQIPENEIRNPFTFHRNPIEEIKLHFGLAESGSIPIESWKKNPLNHLSFKTDFTSVREAYSRKLGLEKDS